MKFLNIMRSQEWWSYKLSPLLAIGYATAIIVGIPIFQIAVLLLFLLFALTIGAIYVSVINDITDLDEDIASGKSNRIQQIPAWLRLVIPAICVSIGFVVGYFIYPDVLSCFFYLLSWIAFSLYSIKPIRLKARGILGVLADGSGSHLFPSLLMVTSITYYSKQDIDWFWMTSIGIWAISYGLRGILWHQFLDRDNDIKVNLNTFASKTDPSEFKIISDIIISVELISFAAILYQISLPIAFIALIFYVMLILIRYKWRGNKIIVIINASNKPFQILMADYYQMFFPIAILITATISNLNNGFVLLAHIILFPYPIWLALQDYILALKIVFINTKNRIQK